MTTVIWLLEQINNALEAFDDGDYDCAEEILQTMKNELTKGK